MKLKGYILGIFSALLYGLSGVFVKFTASSNFNSTYVLMLQYIISSSILTIYCLVKHRDRLKMPKEIFIKLLILGTFGNTITSVAIYGAYSLLDIGTATMLLYLYPSFIAIYYVVFSRTKLSKATVIGIIGTFVGCFLVLNLGTKSILSLNYKGILLGLLAAVSYAFMNIYSKHVISKVPSTVVTLYINILSLILVSMFNLGFYSKLNLITGSFFINVFILSTLCGMIPTLLLYGALKEIGPIKTSIISTMEIPATAIYAIIFFRNALTIKTALGIIFILVSVVMLKKEGDG